MKPLRSVSAKDIEIAVISATQAFRSPEWWSFEITSWDWFIDYLCVYSFETLCRNWSRL